MLTLCYADAVIIIMNIILEVLNFDSGTNQPVESFCYVISTLCEAVSCPAPSI